MGRKKSKYIFDSTGLVRKETYWAQKRFKEYKELYHITKTSDLQLLEEVVFREALQNRYKEKIGYLAKNEKIEESDIVPKHLLKSLDENLDKIITLKEKLGLFEDNKKDDYDRLDILKEKFKKWKEDHVEERQVCCPFCSEIFFLNIRTDKYKASKLKLFKNKVLLNDKLWDLYINKKITKKEFSEVLNVSPDYIDWLKKKIYNKSIS